jgi:hypothetical protein
MCRRIIAALTLSFAAISLVAPLRAEEPKDKKPVRVISTTRDAAEKSKAGIAASRNPTIGAPPTDIVDEGTPAVGSGNAELLSNNPRFREAYMDRGEVSVYTFESQPQPGGYVDGAVPSPRGGFLDRMNSQRRAPQAKQ